MIRALRWTLLVSATLQLQAYLQLCPGGMARSQILDEVMLLVRRLQSLKRLFVQLPNDPYALVHAAEELRLEPYV